MNPATLSRARENIKNELTRRQLAHERYVESLYARLPELRDLDILMKTTMLDGITAVLRENTDPAEAVNAAAKENLGAQEKRRKLLERQQIDPASLEPPVLCARCEDKLSVGGNPCTCVANEASRLQIASLSRKIDMDSMNFDRFGSILETFENSGERQIIQELYDTLSAYARDFSLASRSLMLDDDYPKPGKCFFCASILREVTKKGYWAEYDPASRILAVLEAEKFDRLRDTDGDPRRFFDCDLLVVDDFGAEYVTPFAKAALYELVGARLSERRPTIISSALTFDELAARYTPGLSERIKAGFKMI